MACYSVIYIRGVTDGLSEPRGDEEIERRNEKILKERLAERWDQMESERLLQGLTVITRQGCLLCVSGPDHEIDNLMRFLEERQWGTVVPKVVTIIGAKGE
ncbi:hypothetical protein FJZ28_03130 [Candidatus Peregrinibacteria bacterium]|nr:hypothetical protein [Candidatus Peregrinibacteria bacterium]